MKTLGSLITAISDSDRAPILLSVSRGSYENVRSIDNSDFWLGSGFKQSSIVCLRLPCDTFCGVRRKCLTAVGGMKTLGSLITAISDSDRAPILLSVSRGSYENVRSIDNSDFWLGSGFKQSSIVCLRLLCDTFCGVRRKCLTAVGGMKTLGSLITAISDSDRAPILLSVSRALAVAMKTLGASW